MTITTKGAWVYTVRATIGLRRLSRQLLFAAVRHTLAPLSRRSANASGLFVVGRDARRGGFAVNCRRLSQPPAEIEIADRIRNDT